MTLTRPSRAAMSAQIGERLDMPVEQVFGEFTIWSMKMAAATRAHAAESGIDLRRFNLIAFGGAGPVHAYAIANKLGMRRVLCPLVLVLHPRSAAWSLRRPSTL